MKLVIADDEYPVRYAIKSMIGEMDAAWTVAGEATNGGELLRLLAEHRPNVAIVDVRMPEMSGLDAIREGRKASPLTKWIILSGYSDFRYAQEALKLGASEYMLKPVRSEELERALFATYKDGRDMLLLHNERFGSNLSALINGLLSVQAEERDGIFYTGRFRGAVFEPDRPAGGPDRAAAHGAFYRALTECVRTHAHCGVRLAVVPLPGGELAAVGAWEQARGQEEGGRQVAEFFGAVFGLAARASGAEEAVTVLTTGECRGFKELSARLARLQQLRDLRIFRGFGGTVDYAELNGLAEKRGLESLGRQLAAALELLRDGRYLNAQNAIAELEPSWAAWESESGEAEKRSLLRYMRHVLPGLGLADGGEIGGVPRALKAYGERALRERQSKEAERVDPVAQVLRYVEQHYAEEVGIGQIADLLNVSPSYLSTLFHKRTGVTFMKYLTRLRMGKAEELLLGTRLQVKQIAEAVGYFSTRHFTKLFTETYGKYPSDYRKPP
ncbi:two-component system, response regulator YesN [Paenibacillus sp. UNC496MF]|uniref:response regulator transcription factor n=1 Tax=Paenibacillus sp. UNC496MF TaxID=1502753 RepID=UPI0008E16E2E|nr:helix-turn-helix domain-containing protein [Paenibacillus sp. UNC496MF]SFI34753.1 two-component system, response regulator YesN [Paenibacillus sp. UNC496MF]